MVMDMVTGMTTCGVRLTIHKLSIMIIIQTTNITEVGDMEMEILEFGLTFKL
jgi:hypothetical protein